MRDPLGALTRRLAAATLLAAPPFAATPAAQQPAQQAASRIVAPICIGACPRVVGLRINWRDRDVDRVDGINITMWFPRADATGVTHGLALGLPIASTGNADGFLVAPFLGQAADRLRGIGVAGIAVGADRLTGALASSLITLTGSSLGITVGGVTSISTMRSEGITVGGVLVSAASGWGLATGGIVAHATGGYRGVVVGGLGVVSGAVTGVAVTGGVHYSQQMRGVSFALVNYARSLRGVQLGVVNIVADGRSPRLLPLVNWR